MNKNKKFSDKSLLGLLMNGWRNLPLEKRLELASNEDDKIHSHKIRPSFSHLQKLSSYHNEKGYCCAGIYRPVTLDLINGNKLFDNIIISSPEDKILSEITRQVGGADQRVLYLLNRGFFIREVSLFSDNEMRYPKDKFMLYFHTNNYGNDLLKKIEDETVKMYLKEFALFYRGGNKIVVEEKGWIKDRFPMILNECGYELVETK